MMPPLAYFGAKVTVASDLIALFPEHDGYIEPYGGSLSVLLAKPIERMEVVNDLSQDLMNFWRVLRDRTDELIQVCQLTPHSRAESEASWERGGLDDLERARRVWVRLTQGRTGTLRKSGWRFALNAQGNSVTYPKYMQAYKERLAPAAERLMNVTLECLPALELIDNYGAVEKNLLYVDPPYLGRVRTPGVYEHEMGDEAEHVRLLEMLVQVKAAVVLSGYDDAMYDSLLPGWFKHRIGSWSQSGKRTAEVVWCNRQPERQQSFDFRVTA